MLDVGVSFGVEYEASLYMSAGSSCIHTIAAAKRRGKGYDFIAVVGEKERNGKGCGGVDNTP
jgi:hypothetical protein